jgi:GNAT superfamily N-acetyltransferase
MQLFSDGYEISDDPARLDMELVHGFLSGEAYWSRGVPRDVFERAVTESLNVGVYRDGAQVGYARVVTDRATFAWLCDVFIAADHRGRGLGHWLVESVLTHPDLQGLRRILLATADAHGVYRSLGFTELADPRRFMEIAQLPQDLYGSGGQRAR